MEVSWFENGLGIGILLLSLVIQIILFLRSYPKSAGILSGDRLRRNEIINYWLYFIALDFVNFGLFFGGKNILLLWSATGEDASKIIRNNIDTAMPIITTVLISFFGLTAASYTFQINDIHERQRQSLNDKLFFEVYLKRTRFKFSVALWSTVWICMLSVSVYVLEEVLHRRSVTEVYKAECGFILCVLGTEVILWMLYLNWVLFFHERYIERYTKKILQYIVESPDRNMISDRIELSQLLKRVNSVEMVFQRLLSNNVHVQDVFPLDSRDLLIMLGGELESIGDAERQKGETLVKKYYELINWRNAVIHLKNLNNGSSSVRMILGDQQKRDLQEIEKHIKENRMKNERFTDMDLSSLDFFQGSDLENADFSNCDLRNINLEGSNCAGVNFTNALMSRICLNGSLTGKVIKIDQNTKLMCANFHNCNLENAEIKSVFSDYFSMKESTFSNVILTRSKMERVDFEFSSFYNAQLYYNAWSCCKARIATFTGAKLSNSSLEETDFKRADFSEAVLVDAKISNCCFEEARLYKTDFFNSNIYGGNWSKVMASDASFKSTNIKPIRRNDHAGHSNTSFRQAVLHNVDFTESFFRCIDMTDCQANECIFTGAKGNTNCFSNADMKNCLFNRTEWKCSIFDYVQFDQSVFKNAEFSKSRFIGTSFDQCLFLSTDKNNLRTSRIRTNWEKENLGRSYKPSGKQKEAFLFKDSYLENVSFKGAYGLKEDMFRGAIIVGTDFRGTGIKKCKLEKYVPKLVGCRF